ncbi:alpha/beta hydrolase [Chelativorans sp. M5D2P16]|uniref:alpha/beta hydrolase n=1 Tax=Chelativorans sp. M5D2P16 TaxID=3095678 RepID=UPI002ACABD94|nr:alpha/beta hydrolase [Chelativorans sp. M5D2P16]MDZ5698082.1 alpha/beta hydrolase [Chelativorans sp. M5D2P16]
MEEVVRADGSRRRSSVTRRLAAAAAALLLLVGIAGVIAVQTVPEFILFNKRLALNLYEFKGSIDFQPLDLKTYDGLTMRSWYYPPAPGNPVIVYFPGRDGDLVRKPSHLFQLAEQGYGLTLAGYRGYGGNPGNPSEWLLYRDATTLLGTLADERLAPDGVVIYGYSMGTGVASYAATQVQPRALVLEGPFTSLPDAIHRQVPSVPSWLIRSRFDTEARIRDIHVPILLLAGENDMVTPPTFAEALAVLSKGVSQLQILSNASHLDMYRHGALDAVADFLLRLTGMSDAGTAAGPELSL